MTTTRPLRRGLLVLRICACTCALPAAFAASQTSPAAGNTTNSDPLPEVGVRSIRRVFHNGEHNAFTDLWRFQGQLCTWYSGPGTPNPDDYDLSQHLGFAAWSDDGTTWNSPSCWKELSATTSGTPPRSMTEPACAAGAGPVLKLARAERARRFSR